MYITYMYMIYIYIYVYICIYIYITLVLGYLIPFKTVNGQQPDGPLCFASDKASSASTASAGKSAGGLTMRNCLVGGIPTPLKNMSRQLSEKHRALRECFRRRGVAGSVMGC